MIIHGGQSQESQESPTAEACLFHFGNSTAMCLKQPKVSLRNKKMARIEAKEGSGTDGKAFSFYGRRRRRYLDLWRIEFGISEGHRLEESE
mgnify:CR=1 FL=1